MAATRLKIALCIELGVYLSVFGVLVSFSTIPLTTLLLLAVLTAFTLRMAVVLGSFVFAALAQPRRPSLGALDWIVMVIREFLGLLRFEHLIRWDLKAPPGPIRVDAPLLVLLHGTYCSAAVWQPIVRDLEASTGCGVWAPDIAPTDVDLSTQGLCFARHLEQATAAKPEREVIVVAHSLGGLIARLYLSRRLGAVPIRKLICLGTPHEGTLSAKLLSSRIGHDMRPGSSVLAELGSAPPCTATEIVSYYSEHDNLIIPAASARLAGVRSVAVSGIGHISMIYSRALFELLVREIRAATTLGDSAARQRQ